MRSNIILENAEAGGFNVKIPAFDGCFTHGDTIEEAILNSKEALTCYLEGLQKVNEIKSFSNQITKEVGVAI